MFDRSALACCFALALFTPGCRVELDDEMPREVAYTVHDDGDGRVRVSACRREGAFLFDSCGGNQEDAFDVARGDERWTLVAPAPSAYDGPETFYGPFEAEVPSAVGGEVYSFAWRHGGALVAEGSSVTMPAPLAFTAPAADATLRIGDEVRVAWQPPGVAPSRWRAIVCGVRDPLFGEAYEVAAGADAITIPAGFFFVPQGQRCEVEVVVEQSRAGSLSPELDGGSIVATRATSLRFFVENATPGAD